MVHCAQLVPRVRNQICLDSMGWHIENRVAIRHQGPSQWKTTKSRREPQVGTNGGIDLRGGSVQISSVTQSCLTLCSPMNHSTPGPPVHHQLSESIQIHVH